MLGVLLCALPASAAPVPITQLLKQGFEIRAAYGIQFFDGDVQGQTGPYLRADRAVHYLILQSKDSAYSCNNIGAEDSHHFACYEISDK